MRKRAGSVNRNHPRSDARVVIDTNVVVSAALKRDGLESRVLELALSGRISLFVSPEILAEYHEVLSREKLALRPTAVRSLVDAIASVATLVRPDRTLAVSPDEADNRFLECAVAAQADFLVTGNTRHFPRFHGSAQVVNARQFLAKEQR